MDQPDLEPLRDALVVAVDGSPTADVALRWAADLAAALGRPLHVLHVWNFVSGDGPEPRPDEPPSHEAWQAHAERRLGELLAKQLGERPGLDVQPVVLHGNATPVLLAVSRVASQLVVGNRGRGGLAGLLLGSTTSAVLKGATCPVTVVRPR